MKKSILVFYLLMLFTSPCYCGEINPQDYSFSIYKVECEEYIKTVQELKIYHLASNAEKRLESYTSIEKEWGKKENKKFEMGLNQKEFIKTLDQLEIQSSLKIQNRTKLSLSYTNDHETILFKFEVKF